MCLMSDNIIQAKQWEEIQVTECDRIRLKSSDRWRCATIIPSSSACRRPLDACLSGFVFFVMYLRHIEWFVFTFTFSQQTRTSASFSSAFFFTNCNFFFTTTQKVVSLPLWCDGDSKTVSQRISLRQKHRFMSSTELSACVGWLLKSAGRCTVLMCNYWTRDTGLSAADTRSESRTCWTTTNLLALLATTVTSGPLQSTSTRSTLLGCLSVSAVPSWAVSLRCDRVSN